MLESLKSISERLLEERKKYNPSSVRFDVKGLSQLDGECSIHVSSEDIDIFIKYKSEKCSILYGKLGNLLVHRNVTLEEFTNNSIQFYSDGVIYTDLINRLLPKDRLGIRGIFKIFNFYSSGELILSLYFPYKEDNCGYKVLTYEDIC